MLPKTVKKPEHKGFSVTVAQLDADPKEGHKDSVSIYASKKYNSMKDALIEKAKELKDSLKSK